MQEMRSDSDRSGGRTPALGLSSGRSGERPHGSCQGATVRTWAGKAGGHPSMDVDISLQSMSLCDSRMPLGLIEAHIS